MLASACFRNADNNRNANAANNRVRPMRICDQA